MEKKLLENLIMWKLFLLSMLFTEQGRPKVLMGDIYNITEHDSRNIGGI